LTTVTVPSRFNGPPDSGQGGYTSGTLAAYLDGPAAVSLRRPVPLDEALNIRVTQDDAKDDEKGVTPLAVGAAIGAFAASGELVAEAVAAPPLAPWDAPPVSLEAAHRAKDRFTSPADGTFDRCFVCGRSRDDGFHVHPGPVEGTDLFAAPWTPPAWAADEDGVVLSAFVCAALDCPGYFALHGADLALAFLARQQSEVNTPVRAGVEYVVVGQPLAREGRKGFAATAILDSVGAVLAQSEQLLIAPRQTMSHD
jgi:hypothetical protein